MFFRQFAFSLYAAAALTAGAWAQTTTTTTFTQTLTFAPVGLASSETAQINVANIAANAANGTAASCTGSISFLNASGTVIGTAASFTVAGGKTDSVTLPYSSTAASGRTEIRGVITLTTTSGAFTPCNLLTSMETFDTTSGATHSYFAGPSVASSPRAFALAAPVEGR
jgi:hypothetical protein